MELKKYLKTTTQTAFAESMRCSQGLVHQWVKGITRITAERCIEIEAVTNGKVTRHDLRPDLFGKADSKQDAA